MMKDVKNKMYKKTGVVIYKSDKPGKKKKAVIDGRKTVHSGQKCTRPINYHKNCLDYNDFMTKVYVINMN